MTTGTPGSELLTVVFVDVEGSTALLDSVGDEAGLVAVDRQLGSVRERIEAYKGHEVKSLGDGLLLVFGSPRLAVSFALASQRALAGTTPRVRFGINTGEVQGGGADPTGGAVNAAARIADRAAGGEVLVSAVVRQLVGSAPAVRFVERGRVRLKGFTERWQLYEAVDGAAATPATTIGRVGALAAIDRLVTSTAQGQGGALILEGEAGIGKTHLVRHAVETARTRGLRVLETAADELEQRPGVVAHGLLDGVRAPSPARNHLLEQLSTRDALDGADPGFAIIEASIDLIESLTGPVGVLVVAEDLHWADDLSLRVLAAIAGRAGPSPVAVVASCRPVPRPELLDRLLDRVQWSGGEVVHLDPLAEVDVIALATAHLGAAPGPALRDRLAAASGNPLFAGELLRSFEDDGLLRVEAGVADLTDPGLPADLRSTLIRRLSWLDEDVVELLRLASILGGSFTLRDLAAVTGRTVIDVAARLHGASQAALVVGDGDRLTFRHDLVREAIYEDMVPAVRRDLHRAAGEALAARGGPVVQVAKQFALGARPGDVDAVDWLERAAVECSAVDPSTAIDLLEQALALAPADWPDRARLGVRLLEPYARSGRFDTGEAVAADVLASTSDPTIEYLALRGLSAILGTRGVTDRSLATLHEAAEAAVEGGPPGAAQELRLLAAQIALTSGSGSRADRDVVVSGLTEAEEAGDAKLQCVAHQSIGFFDAVEGRYPEALQHFQISAALLESGRAPWNAYLAPHSYASACLAELDRLDEAAAAADTARRRAEDQAARSHLPFTYFILGVVPLFAGRFDDATVPFEAGLSLVEEISSFNFALYLEAGLARIALRRGDLPGADAHLTSGGARLATGTVRFGADWLMDTQAELLCARGDHLAALDLLEVMWTQTAPVRFFFGFRSSALRLARLAHGAGRRDIASEVVTALEEAAQRSPAISATAAARRGRGILDHDSTSLLDAVALYRRTPLRPDLAECCEDAAAVLVDHGQRFEATALLDEAVRIHADTGADGDLARAEQALRRLDGRRRAVRAPRPTVGWEALTPMERRVVDLVAEGRTNPDIGARLFISRRTVETHLSHVFQKVGLSSRTQVAAEHARRSM